MTGYFDNLTQGLRNVGEWFKLIGGNDESKKLFRFSF